VVLKFRRFGKEIIPVWNVFSCVAGEAWRRSSWTDRVKNEVLRRVKKERNIVGTIKQRKVNWISHILSKNCLLKHVIKRKDRSDGKTRKKTEIILRKKTKIILVINQLNAQNLVL